MEPVKFDLPLNDTKIGTLDDLKNNLPVELIELFCSGKLAKWFRSWELNEKSDRDIQLLKNLCQIFTNEFNENGVCELIETYERKHIETFDKRNDSNAYINKEILQKIDALYIKGNSIPLDPENQKNFFYLLGKESIAVDDVLVILDCDKKFIILTRECLYSISNDYVFNDQSISELVLRLEEIFYRNGFFKTVHLRINNAWYSIGICHFTSFFNFLTNYLAIDINSDDEKFRAIKNQTSIDIFGTNIPINAI